MVVPLAVVPGHQGIDAHAGADSDGGDDQLNRVDDGEGGEAVTGELAHKIAVHDVVHGLDQLGQHDRRRDPHQDGPDALCIKEAVCRGCSHDMAVLLTGSGSSNLPQRGGRDLRARL